MRRRLGQFLLEVGCRLLGRSFVATDIARAIELGGPLMKAEKRSTSHRLRVADLTGKNP